MLDKVIIIELSVHACNFVVKVLHREESGARFWSKLMLKLQPEKSHFSKFHYIHLPSCIISMPIPLSTLVTQLSKSVEKNLADHGLLNFWNKLFMPLYGDAKWKFEHNSGHKQTKLLTRSPYSVFGE